MKAKLKMKLIDIAVYGAITTSIVLFIAAMIIPSSLSAEGLDHVEPEAQISRDYDSGKTFEFLDFSGKKLIASGTYGSSTLETIGGQEKVTKIGGRLGKGSENSSAFLAGSYTEESGGTKWIQATAQLQAQGDSQTLIQDVLEGRLVVGGEIGFIKLDTDFGTDTDLMYGIYGGIELPVLDSVSIDITYHYDWTRLIINNVEVDKITSLEFNLNYYF